MYSFPQGISIRRACATVALFVAVVPLVAQSTTGNPGQTTAPASRSQAAPEPANPENEWLAKTSKLYFSSAKAGLAGFNCEIHPDWHALFVSANKGAEAPGTEPYVAQLKKVKVRMHARMQGGSTLEWV